MATASFDEPHINLNNVVNPP